MKQNCLRIVVCLSALFITSTTFSQTPVPFESGDDLHTIRQKIKQNGYSFTVRDYKAELGKEFFVSGLFPAGAKSGLNAKMLPAKEMAIPDLLPASFDWRNVNGKSYIGPIRDQMQAGTCGMFAACAAAESVFNIHGGFTDEQCIDLSESYLSWTLGQVPGYSEHFSGWMGADTDFYTLTALTKLGIGTGKEGVCFESDFPYQDVYPGDEYSNNSLLFPRIYLDNWFRVSTPRYEDMTNAIKAAILQYGCVNTALNVIDAFYAYAGGVYEDTQTEPDASPYFYSTANHAIALVGWDDNPPEGGGGCWILRNSWGTDWGENGYMRIRYESARVNMYPCVLIMDEESIHAYTTGVEQAGMDRAALAGYIKTGTDENVSYYFEYGTEKSFSQKTATRTVPHVSGRDIYRVTEMVSGLSQNQKYEYRLVVPNGTKPIIGMTDSFTLKGPSAEPEPPVVRKNYLNTTFTSAVQTRNLPTRVSLEYGETPEYGKIKTFSTVPRDQEIRANIQDLLPATTYHYRWVLDNGVGPVYLNDATFTSSQNIFRNGFESDEDNPTFRASYFINGQRFFDHSYNWTRADGSLMPKQNPSSAFSGKKNYVFAFDPLFEFEKDYTEEVGIQSYLTSLPLCLNQFERAWLSFYYAQPAWGEDQDELRVYYQSSPNGNWILLPGAEFRDNVTEWTRRVIELPDLSDSYSIRFGATGNFGWGVLLDEIEILRTYDTNVLDWNLY
ncbi:MAG TPA: C1 family peptidase [bacterium]|nr:C1 family peptidase [bacterium]